MRRATLAVLICLALGGCATSGAMSSLSSIGGVSEPAKPAPAAPKQEESSSGLGGIWKNFSSPFSSGAQPVSQTPAGQPFAQSFDASAALRLINNYRSTKGLAPLSIDQQATAAAEVLAKDMALHDRMSHIGPNGQDAGKRLLAAGYNFSIASENVAVGQASIEETVDGWKASPANSRNMLLANAKHIGVAYESRPDSQHKTFWVLVVAAP
ncbi:MAG: CAP domain-containing protein [Rhodomicrobium sp.]